MKRPVVLHAEARGPMKPVWVPIASTIAASALSLLPIVTSTSLFPPFGLLMALAWRLLRPEMWPASMALALGLADDLLSGHFLGTSMAQWTLAFLALDWVDHHVVWRDYWMEWVIAASSIVAIGTGSWAFNHSPGMIEALPAVLPSIISGILLFPATVRIAAILDRWRLRR